MNATLQSSSQPVSPLMLATSEVGLESGSETKHRWIGEVLKDMHRTNELMARKHGSEAVRVVRPAAKS